MRAANIDHKYFHATMYDLVLDSIWREVNVPWRV